MSLLAAWKDSLELLRPKNVKLLMLVSLNAFVKGLGVFFRSVIWSFIPLQVLLLVLFSYSGLGSYPFGIENYYVKGMADSILTGFFSVTVYPMLFICCLIARPSVNRKTVFYFLSFYKMFFLMIFLFVLFVLMGNGMSGILYLIRPGIGLGAFYLWMLFFLDIVLVPGMLFALDSPGTCKGIVLSWWRELKMVVYNMPAFFCIAFIIALVRGLVALAFAMIIYSPFIRLLYVIGNSIDIMLNKLTFGYYSGHWFISMQATNIELYAAYFLVFLFSTSIISTIYTKKLHDNKDLYI